MTTPPESVHDRLNREMYRHYFGGWKLWAAVLPVMALFLWALIPQPRDITYRLGIVTGVATLIGEAGPIIRIGVDLDGTRVEAGARAKLNTPDAGTPVCLSHNIGRWTGAETFTLTDMRFCKQTDAIGTVEKG